ncbi:MAG: type II toxin-antitoxin system PemK/MazF family toxin [Phycisphaerae bacterium]|nr:type II toxin-antitoxin system PemK/MazF family toxin [Phycisphaerae bacterium]
MSSPRRAPVPSDDVREGQIFWLADCPSLEGDVMKTRPIVVIHPQPFIDRGDDPLMAIAISTSVTLASSPDRVKVPNRQENPGCSTNLPVPCWAVPKWHILVQRAHLIDRAGYANGRLLKRVRDAAMARLAQEDAQDRPRSI